MKKLLNILLSTLLVINVISFNSISIYASENKDDYSFVSGYYDIDIDTSKYIVKDNYSATKASFPSKYNLVEQGYVTSVKNQDTYGTCWAHAILASAESSSIMDGEFKLSDNPDLSEVNLAYFEYVNHYKDDLNLITDDYSSLTSFGDGDNSIFNQGGNLSIAMMNLPSGIGFSDESRLPYSVIGKRKNYIHDNFVNTYIKGNESWCYDNDYRVINIESISMSQTDYIKQMLMTEGALGVSYHHDDSYFNSETNGYYYYSLLKQSNNHAVTLVGWDDNYSSTNFNTGTFWPKSNGAWIIKNSWDSDWGDNGYFYISYNDVGITSDLAFLFDIEKTNDDDRIYQYDGTFCYSEVTNKKASTHYEANVFTAQRDEYVNRVGFYTTGSGVEFEAYVYTNLTNANVPTSGTLVSSISGKATFGGYHSFKLNDYVFLNEGDVFSVVIKLSGDNAKSYYIDQSYNGSWNYTVSDYKAGQSFFSTNNKNWEDTATRSNNKGNLRVKCYTNTTLLNDDQTYATYEQNTGVTVHSNSASLIKQINEIKLDSTTTLTGEVDDNDLVIGNDSLFNAGAVSEGNHTLKIKTTSGFEKSLTLSISYSKDEHTVTFDTNGGSDLETNEKTYTFGNAYGTLPETDLEGYTFDGWFTDKEEGTKITPTTVFTAIANQTLYAHFTAKTFTVSFDTLDKNITNPKSITVTYDSKYGSLPSIDKTGYTFDGWYTSETDGELVDKDNDVKILDNQTLYAHFTAKTFTISFDCVDSKIANPEQIDVTYDELFGDLPTPEKYKHIFKGWYLEDTYDTLITSEDTVNIVEDQTLYAKWELDGVKVIVNPTLGEEGDILYINGQPLAVDEEGNIIADKDVSVALSYTVANKDKEDIHTQYPLSMTVYLLEDDGSGNKTLVHHENLDNILTYSGASIRITGNKGIRIITTIPTEKKNKLIKDGIDGYIVMEYGTIMCWASSLPENEEPVLYRTEEGTFKAKYGSKGRAYDRSANLNSIYKESNGKTQYTNTLVGNYTDEQCSSDFAMRSYIIIRPKGATTSENDIVLYGGTLYRSIAYVALQNKTAFKVGTDGYKYIWKLIKTGYSDIYNNEYQTK